MTIRQLSSDELATLFVKEKVVPLDSEFSVFNDDDPLWSAGMIHKLEPVRRRQFLCEKVEESYRQLLAAAKDGPEPAGARATLGKAIEDNLRWAKNNVAGFGLECEEFPLFIRIEELSVQYQKALQDLERPTLPVTLETVADKVNSLHDRADSIHADTRELKTTIPAALAGQARTIRDQEDEIARLKTALSMKLSEMAGVYHQVAPQDMHIFVAFMKTGNQVRAAQSLGIKEQTLRARVAQWPRKGAAYQRIHKLYQEQKESGRAPNVGPYFENLLVEGRPTPDVDSRVLMDIAEIVMDMNPQNVEQKKEVLLTRYLKEFVSR
jgi:DNA-binding protein Fis